jgi:hypothetical protein
MLIVYISNTYRAMRTFCLWLVTATLFEYSYASHWGMFQESVYDNHPYLRKMNGVHEHILLSNNDLIFDAHHELKSGLISDIKLCKDTYASIFKRDLHNVIESLDFLDSVILQVYEFINSPVPVDLCKDSDIIIETPSHTLFDEDLSFNNLRSLTSACYRDVVFLKTPIHGEPTFNDFFYRIMESLSVLECLLPLLDTGFVEKLIVCLERTLFPTILHTDRDIRNTAHSIINMKVYLERELGYIYEIQDGDASLESLPNSSKDLKDLDDHIYVVSFLSESLLQINDIFIKVDTIIKTQLKHVLDIVQCIPSHAFDGERDLSTECPSYEKYSRDNPSKLYIQNHHSECQKIIYAWRREFEDTKTMCNCFVLNPMLPECFYVSDMVQIM